MNTEKPAAEWVRIGDLLPWERNPKAHPTESVAEIARSIVRFGFTEPIIPWRSRKQVVAGHGRLLAAQMLYREDPGRKLAPDQPGDAATRPEDGLVPVRWIEFLNDHEAAAYAIADNRLTEKNPMDAALVAEIFVELDDAGVSLEGLGYDSGELLRMLDQVAPPEQEVGSNPALEEAGEPAASAPGNGSLSDRFGVPPFSVLDARQGYWQKRKQVWLERGIRSGEGRTTTGDKAWGRFAEEKPTAESTKRIAACGDGPTIFDPVLCELAYRWFAPKGGTVLDPFAGGSVRGVVAAACGLQYVGVDLRSEQVEANRRQWEELGRHWPDAPPPVWHCSDSRLIPGICHDLQADLVFSCPPYADLEVYSDNPQDLSTLDYPAFRAAYREIIAHCAARLKPDRFACFVVGDVRDSKGFYLNFPADTIAAFQDAGCILYNEAILINAVGSLALRAGKQFNSGRKLGKSHQNVLVFYKGNPKNIKEIFGEVEIALPPEEAGNAATDN